VTSRIEKRGLICRRIAHFGQARMPKPQSPHLSAQLEFLPISLVSPALIRLPASERKVRSLGQTVLTTGGLL